MAGDQADRRQHPVFAGMTAFIGIGLAIGLLFAAGAFVASKALGLGSGGTGPVSTQQATMVVPLPVKTTPTAPVTQAQVTQTPEASPTEPVTPITLTTGQTVVTSMQQIDLTGAYPTGEGAVLQVQRLTAGTWQDFPVEATVNSGTFSTFIQTGKTGQGKFRMLDPETGATSNEVTVTINP